MRVFAVAGLVLALLSVPAIGDDFTGEVGFASSKEGGKKNLFDRLTLITKDGTIPLSVRNEDDKPDMALFDALFAMQGKRVVITGKKFELMIAVEDGKPKLFGINVESAKLDKASKPTEGKR